MSKYHLFVPALAGLAFLAAAGTSARATPVTFAGISSNGLSAQASFDYTGTTLTVTVSNSASGSTESSFVSALYFSTGGQALSLGSIQYAFGDTYNLSTNGTPDPVTTSGNTSAGAYKTDLFGHWAFKGGLNGAGDAYGFGGAGLGIFGPHDLIGGGTPGQNGEPGGPGYTIASGNVRGVNTGATSNNPYVVGTATFVFQDVSSFDTSKIGGVSWQYGTSTGDPRLTPTTANPTSAPLPGVAAAGVGLLGTVGGVGLLRRRRVAA